MNRLYCVFSLCVLGVGFISERACGAGMEDFGNNPLNAADYSDWPGIMPVVNHNTRVYHSWVNGNEHFYYRGNAEALNDVLKEFAAAKVPVRQVVLRPGPGMAQTFDPTKRIACHWQLHIVGGIAKAMTRRDQGERIWSQHPTLTVFIGEEIAADRLSIPSEVTLLDLDELAQRYRLAFTSTHKDVRGWAAGQLASLDPYSDENMMMVARLLADPDDWIRLNAAGALAGFGSKAKPALPALRRCLESSSEQLKSRAQETITRIEGAQDKPEEERQFREALESIREFRRALEARSGRE